jgi:hypothetical protein
MYDDPSFAQATFQAGKGRRLLYQQWQDLLMHGHGNHPRDAGYSPAGLVGEWSVPQASEVTGDERCKDVVHRVKLSLPMVRSAFLTSQAAEELTAGQQSATDKASTLDWDEFCECVARCALDKYAPIQPMSDGERLLAFVRNLLGDESTEASMHAATLITTPRFPWQRESSPLPGQPLATHKRWIEVWRRLSLADLHHFPLWEREVHNALQTHFEALCQIFLAYSRSLLGSDTVADANEMEMAEFKSVARPSKPCASSLHAACSIDLSVDWGVPLYTGTLCPSAASRRCSSTLTA